MYSILIYNLWANCNKILKNLTTKRTLKYMHSRAIHLHRNQTKHIMLFVENKLNMNGDRVPANENIITIYK